MSVEGSFPPTPPGTDVVGFPRVRSRLSKLPELRNPRAAKRMRVYERMTLPCRHPRDTGLAVGQLPASAKRQRLDASRPEDAVAQFDPLPDAQAAVPAGDGPMDAVMRPPAPLTEARKLMATSSAGFRRRSAFADEAVDRPNLIKRARGSRVGANVPEADLTRLISELEYEIRRELEPKFEERLERAVQVVRDECRDAIQRERDSHSTFHRTHDYSHSYCG